MTRLLLAAFHAAILFAATAHAQPYPSRPLKIIVPFSPGGAADSLPRLLGPKLTAAWGQPVVIENRTGAAGNIGMEAGAKAAPDGYTLTSAPVGNLAINPHLYTKLPYDVFKDFTLITLVGSVDNVLVISPSVPAQTLGEFVKYAKANPGRLGYGSGGVGSQAHMGGELLKAAAGIDMVHVAYKGVGDSIKDLLGGQLAMICAQVPSAAPLVKSGKLRALALAGAKRSPILPEVPTVNEALGTTGFEAVSWYALVGPAGIPADVVAKIQSEVSRAVQAPDVREKMEAVGAEPVGSTPAQLAAILKQDYDRYGAIIQRLGIKAD